MCMCVRTPSPDPVSADLDIHTRLLLCSTGSRRGLICSTYLDPRQRERAVPAKAQCRPFALVLRSPLIADDLLIDRLVMETGGHADRTLADDLLLLSPPGVKMKSASMPRQSMILAVACLWMAWVVQESAAQCTGLCGGFAESAGCFCDSKSSEAK